MTLKDLNIGDRYTYPGRKEIWLVRGNPTFNARHGSSTRVCMKYSDNSLHSKSCRAEVIKIGESPFKEKYKLKPINFR